MLCAAAIAANVPRASAQTTFTLTSTDLPAGKPVPPSLLFDQTDCKGGNRSPQLSWHGAPAATRSFAITMIDPDAPGRGWWHWAVAGIPATVTQLPGNASASGALRKMGAVESRNDFDVDGYGGPCPPPGDHPHRYLFTVFAVKSEKLDVKADTSAAVVGFNLHFVTLAKADIMGLFKR